MYLCLGIQTKFSCCVKQIYRCKTFQKQVQFKNRYLIIFRHRLQFIAAMLYIFLCIIYNKCVLQNAKLGNIPHYEHDDALFLEKREQMHYNVEDRARIEAKYQMPPRSRLLRPDFHHHTSRYVAIETPCFKLFKNWEWRRMG